MKEEKGFRKYLGGSFKEAGFNISWSAVFAGVVTFLAILFTLSLIGTAIGFGVVEPTSADPFDGVGTGMIIWTILAFVLSLAAAGFISGLASRKVGLLHGFLTWATSVLLFLVVLYYMTAGIFSALGNLLGNVFSVAGEGAGAVASGVEDIVTSSFDGIVSSVDEVDTDELQGEVESVLQDTDVPELQPDYFEDQLNEVTDEIAEGSREIVTNPENAEDVISSIIDSLESRAQTIADAADRDAIASAVESNTELTDEEAEEATDNIFNAYETAAQEAETILNDAAQSVEQAQQDIDNAIEDARVAAEEASDAASKASIWGFVALLLGLILTSVFGLLGSNFVKNPDIEEKI